jgi:short-subunit dehydrogenase
VTPGAAALPLRGLATAGRELAESVERRYGSTGRRRAEAALDVARAGGWALVTGGSAGIGRAYAAALAAGGIDLLLVADDGSALAAAADDIAGTTGVACDTLAVDLADRAAVARVLSWVGERRVDVLVNNAGVGLNGPFCRADAEAYAAVVDVDVVAPVLLTRGLLPAMVERGTGVVVHVASLNALAPMPRSAVYSAGKAFLLSYATAVWHEHRGSGVVFQTLLPGTTATAFHERQGTSLPPWAMRPEDVVASSLAALGRAPTHVPGRLNRLLRALGAALPLEQRTAAAGAVLAASLGDA